MDTIEHGEFDPTKSEYKALTDKEVDDMAKKLYRNEIFTSWMIPENDNGLLPNIFMPLIFIDDLTRRGMQRDNIQHLWANMSDAGSRGINGYPMFMSMSMLDGNDARRIHARYLEIRTLLDD